MSISLYPSEKGLPADDNSEIDEVPTISEVRIAMHHEAKCYYLEHGFHSKDEGEDFVDLIYDLIPTRLRLPIAVVIEA